MITQIVSLALTIITESIGVVIFSLTVKSLRKQIPANLAVVALVNLATHTIFWYTFPLIGGEFLFKIYFFESIIVLVEGFAYHLLCRMRLGTALLASFLLNCLSFYAGYIWHLLF